MTRDWCVSHIGRLGRAKRSPTLPTHLPLGWASTLAQYNRRPELLSSLQTMMYPRQHRARITAGDPNGHLAHGCQVVQSYESPASNRLSCPPPIGTNPAQTVVLISGCFPSDLWQRQLILLSRRDKPCLPIRAYDHLQASTLKNARRRELTFLPPIIKMVKYVFEKPDHLDLQEAG